MTNIKEDERAVKRQVLLGQPKVSLVRQQLTDSIRDAILEMRLLPGDRLIERELVEWSGVSRATVRESIRELESENLVKIIPQRGAIVASPSLREATEIYTIRATLEGLAGRECATNATPAQVRALRRAFEAFSKTDPEAGTMALLQAKSRFYAALFDGAGNESIKDILSRLQARVTMLRSITMAQAGRITTSIGELERIVVAIEAGDADVAEQACMAHVRSAGEIGLAALRATEEGADTK